MINHTDAIGKQRAPPQPTERTMTVLKLTEGLGLTDNLASRCLMTVVLTSNKEEGYLLGIRRF
jgi:hypothetical protein